MVSLCHPHFMHASFKTFSLCCLVVQSVTMASFRMFWAVALLFVLAGAAAADETITDKVCGMAVCTDRSGGCLSDARIVSVEFKMIFPRGGVRAWQRHSTAARLILPVLSCLVPMVNPHPAAGFL